MLTTILAACLAVPPAAYPNAKLLVDAADLAKPGAAAKLRVLDVRGPETYAAGHVVGAVRAPVSAWSKAFVANKADAAYWKAELAAVGVTPSVPVVVYGDIDIRESCRAWWLLRRAGVADVRVLHGGYPDYVAAKGATGTAPATAAAAPHDWTPAPEQHATKEDVLKMLKEKAVVLIDGRSAEEYAGGHIPGAVPLEWADFLEEGKMRHKSAADLAKLLESRKVRATDPACTYCQSGGRAAVVAFGLELMGGSATRTYYRSWSEWGKDADTPKEPHEVTEVAPAAFDFPEFARSLFDESGDAMLLVEPDTDRLLEANRTALRLTGFSRGELEQVPATSLFRFERGSPAPARMAAKMTTVFHGRDGYFLRTKADPGWRPVTLTVTRLHLSHSTLALFTARDDTARQAAQELVRKSEERFRTLVERSGDGIAIVDAEGGVIYASPGARLMFGANAPADGLGLIATEDIPRLRSTFAGLAGRPGGEARLRLRWHASDDRLLVVEAVVRNRVADPGIGGFLLNFRDITDRVRAETELARQFGILQTVFEATPDIIVVKDTRDAFVTGNRAFEQLAGCPVDMLLGKTCREVFVGEWADRIREVEARVIDTGVGERIELWVDHADGAPRLLDCAISPTRDGLVIVGRDVTDRRKLEDQVRDAQKMDAVGQLAGGVAHDFNNLLTVILGNLDLMRAPGHDPAELLASTEVAARRAAELTGQLLGFARRKPMRFLPTDLNDHVAETAGLLRRTIDPRVVIREQPRPELWPTLADPGQMNQVLMNLCLNARDAMPDGGTLTLSTANVTLRTDDLPPHPLARPGKFVRLRVSDTGTGMAPDVVARMYEPFFTTKPVGRGTGLGLAVVFGIVQAHRGWIECVSTPGQGTAFEVYVPMHDDPAPSARPAAAPRATPTGKGERILLADDEVMIRDLANAVLTRLGYKLTLACDGAEAVAAFAAGPFDAVVLDLTMPNLSGREALMQIRAAKPDVPVILASGYSADQSTVAGMNVRFLDKPYTPSDLARAVREVIDKK